MTINKELFVSKWAFLCARFDREVDREEAKEYYRWLNVHGLDDDTFVYAIEKIWADFKFFPRPRAFKDLSDEKSMRIALPPPERDPWWQPVRRILKGSKEGQHWARELEERRRGHVSVEEDTGPPFYFPRVRIQVVDDKDLVGVVYEDRVDLRKLYHRETGRDPDRKIEVKGIPVPVEAESRA